MTKATYRRKSLLELRASDGESIVSSLIRELGGRQAGRHGAGTVAEGELTSHP